VQESTLWVYYKLPYHTVNVKALMHIQHIQTGTEVFAKSKMSKEKCLFFSRNSNIILEKFFQKNM